MVKFCDRVLPVFDVMFNLFLMQWDFIMFDWMVDVFNISTGSHYIVNGNNASHKQRPIYGNLLSVPKLILSDIRDIHKH